MRKSGSKSNKKKVLPQALLKRARQAHERRIARLRTRALELVALVRRRKAEIADAFYDMGEALRELGTDDMLLALRRKSFEEVCKKDCGISVALADSLVKVVKAMTRREAIRFGRTKAIALVELAAATPADDTPAGLARQQQVRLADGESVDPRRASAQTIEAAAKRERQFQAARRGGARRGRTTTAEERALAAELQKRLRKRGLDRVTVTAVATKPGRESDLRIEHVPCGALGDVAHVLVALQGARAGHRRAPS